MKWPALFLLLLPVAAGILESPRTLRFAPSESPVVVKLPVPPADRDFTKARALVFEFQSDSTIRFRLGLKNSQGQVFSFRVNPFENLRVRGAIDAQYLTGGVYMNNQSHAGYMISNWGNHIDLSQVVEIEIEMQPNRPVNLQLGPITLAREPVAPAVLQKQPVVDEFGQWMLTEWPDKIRSLDNLKTRWSDEDRSLAAQPDFGWTPYGGWKGGPRQQATGYFRASKIDGRWWLIDPEGAPFWSIGMDCIRPGEATPVQGREFLYKWLPPTEQGRRGVAMADFYRANVERRLGPDWRQPWKRKQEARLANWGFNTIANWSDPLMFSPAALPYVHNASPVWRGKNWVEFPDVFAPEYRSAVENAMRAQVEPFAKDRFLIGWFIGNEPRWHDRNLVERILADPDPSATRTFAESFLKQHGDSAQTRAGLLEALARQYYKIARDAIRRWDPNHMVLGIRYAGSMPDAILRANDIFDMFSINIYRFAPNPEQLNRIARTLDKPILIGEFHFGAAERGMAPSLVLVKDQHERAVAYQHYVEQAAAHPSVVGAHYFQLIDQAVTGRFDGEFYNLGFVSQQDLPYRELTSASQAVARRIYSVHSGRTAPSAAAAKVR